MLPFPGEGAEEESSPPKPKKKHPVVRGFGVERQAEFLEWMMQGASPQIACKKIKISLAEFWKALEHDPAFAAELQKVWDALSYNVVSALYQAAIKGNGQAQQFWLKHRPPPRWAIAGAEFSPLDDLDTLTHDELLERVRAEAPDLAAEIAARIATKRSRLSPEIVPPGAASPCGTETGPV